MRHYPRLLAGLNRSLKANQVARGYRPRRAVIDLPAEGALAFLDHLAAISQQNVQQGALQHSVNGAEYLHLVKNGNNVKTMASGRVIGNDNLLHEYHTLVAPDVARGDPVFLNPLFRRGLLLAMLTDRAVAKVCWYFPMGKTLADFDVEVFIRRPRPQGETTQENVVPQFANDAATKLRHIAKSFTERITTMPEAERPQTPLELLVEQVIRSYLLGKAKAKCNHNSKTKLKDLSKDEQQRLFEQKRKIAQETFLAARSRREQDFVKYFSEVICSAGTFFDRRTRDFQDFAAMLIDPKQTDNIKTLTLLALSAHS